MTFVTLVLQKLVSDKFEELFTMMAEMRSRQEEMKNRMAYAECPLDVRESLIAQNFVDAIRDEDTQHSTILMKTKDLKSSLAYSSKYGAAKTVSKTSRHVKSIENEINRIEIETLGVTEVSGQFRYAVTYFLSQVSQKGVLVAVALVDLKREAIPVRVLNLDNKPKTVDKGAVIAMCEPVVDIITHPQEFSEAQHLPSILENLEGVDEEQRTVRKFQNLFFTCCAAIM
ncbi:hypothetical protein AVEN_219332-1 [Araneus ventricosus]|uniref:Uncharacterized protein n=1 Tax=Araneus ventricosus TaxID=182803 RepID=A0A4Y2BHP5_ARAVE|nr:hypothetical protein AVEN_219332-1 [Araneus ventricosus]